MKTSSIVCTELQVVSETFNRLQVKPLHTIVGFEEILLIVKLILG